MKLKFINKTRFLELYIKCSQIGSVLFKFRSYGEHNCFLVRIYLSGVIMHFGKREPEGHLGFAVALEMLKGMNLFWHLGLFWTQFLAWYLFLYTN